ncbi:MAG: hypothetical protein IKK50_00135 [Ruminiclostridium sp.]|nr:hypothetical protein [Ruminiclostridium sp.]
MKHIFSNIQAGFQRFAAGRYGYDEPAKTGMLTAMALVLCGYIPGLEFLSPLGLALWFWLFFRAMSRNTEKRLAERNAYLSRVGRIKGWFRLKKTAWKERKTHRCFRCSQCGTILRVPKGKGTVKISCPNCRSEFTQKT